MLTYPHPRSPPLAHAHPPSSPLTPAHPRSPAPALTHAHPRSPPLTPAHPRSPTLAHAPSTGLHPNAEIGFLVRAAESLFVTILQLGGGGGDEGGGGGGGVVRAVMNELSEKLPPNFIMLLIMETAAPFIEDSPHAPFVVCSIQECARMNNLLGIMRSSLVDLDKGLKGQLNMTKPMEDMITAFTINEWPGRNPFSKCTWEKGRVGWLRRCGVWCVGCGVEHRGDFLCPTL